jgi:hypothetical protein
MRRVLQFSNWKAGWWMKRARVSLRKGLPDTVTEGLRAYATEQADMEQRIHTAWATKWASTRQLAQPLLLALDKPIQDAAAGDS